MSFIRPEARALLWRWREVGIGLAVALLGLRWALGHGLLQWLGVVVLLAGVALMLAGWQRARFRQGRGGPGIVRVDEGQVAYFGPLNGGAVALADLVQLELDGASRPPVWVLLAPGAEELRIPVTAENAEALFDAFASLPGMATEKMLAEMKRRPPHPVVIWQREAVRLH